MFDNRVARSLILASTTAALGLVCSVAAADDPPCSQSQVCEYENVCHLEAVPCGENPDGTVNFCLENVCEEQLVCHSVPCVTEPSPDPDLPGLPDFPDIPDFPGFPDDPGFPTF
jgi:hypothetical protein